ncbi:ATP-binding protein [Paraburkholderia sp. SARCC-3016]|jgi:signal transduction histidine kinase|uniref:sensor histidine kinase n=1 Tax=Paraburkholderia sp. SARCC-3016 TaxID=3058611 RepID=UPI002806C4E5|nr:ATP-binding protein [Paraburkholderia sp. SARCC-3016]MDQ7982372.1 ATP-binding protein [Paraburkholderia sp. SARCC-3016]
MLHHHYQNDSFLAGIDLSDLYDAVQGVRDLLGTALKATGAQRVVLASIKRSAILIEAEGFTESDQTNVRIHPRVFLDDDPPRAIVEIVANARAPLALDDLNVLYQSDEPFSHSVSSPQSLLCLPVIHVHAVIGAILLIGNSTSQLTLADRYALGTMAKDSLMLLGHPDYFEVRQNSGSANIRAEIALDTIRHELGEALRVDHLATSEGDRVPRLHDRLYALLEQEASGVRWLQPSEPPREKDNSTLWRVVSDTTRTLRLIGEFRELIDGSRTRRGVFDLNEVVIESLASLGPRLRQANVRAKVQNFLTGESLVAGDRMLVSQAVRQALNNSVDAMSGIDDRDRILSVRCDRIGAESIGLEISDTGSGMEGEAEKLFTAFYTTKPERLGLGLALIRLIFELHNGTATVEPNVPFGLIFRATLPMCN